MDLNVTGIAFSYPETTVVSPMERWMYACSCDVAACDGDHELLDAITIKNVMTTNAFVGNLGGF